MRDIGGLIWVVLVIVGVVSSIVQSSRKQARLREPGVQPVPAAPAAAGQRLVQVVQAAAVARSLPAAPPPATAAAPAVPPPRPLAPAPPRPAERPRAPAHPAGDVPGSSRSVAWFFAGRTPLARAVIAATVLGKPRALGDEYPGV